MPRRGEARARRAKYKDQFSGNSNTQVEYVNCSYREANNEDGALHYVVSYWLMLTAETPARGRRGQLSSEILLQPCLRLGSVE